VKNKSVYIPKFLVDIANKQEKHRPWVDALPGVVAHVSKKWNLEPGEPIIEHTTCSYVAPCTMDGGGEAILKIGLPHPEAAHEMDGLRIINGGPTVRLLQFDPASGSMLLEKCNPGTHLNTEPDSVQDEIICQLLKEIWEVEYTVGPFRNLGEMINQWNHETYSDIHLFPDEALAKAGCKMKEELVASTKNNVLLATDLHAGNVLRAERRPWLAIDLKPYYGDPAYDLTQHLLNCKERLAQSLAETVQRVSDLAGIDSTRLSKWMFARLASEERGANQALALQFR
jgi:streptomycin 6-kinase